MAIKVKPDSEFLNNEKTKEENYKPIRKNTVFDVLSNFYYACLAYGNIHKIEFGIKAWDEFLEICMNKANDHFRDRGEKVNISNVTHFWTIPVYRNDSLQANVIEIYTDSTIQIIEV